MRLEATRYSRKNVLSSGPVVSHPLRNARSCNALAFAHAEPNYLAVGLDKVRNESSLVIWDISTGKPLLTHSPVTPSSARNDDQVSPPETRPPTTTLSQASVKIPRGEVGSRADTRILQQYATTDIVSSLAFVPNSVLLLAGVSQRWLRLYDLRMPLTQPNIEVASKVQGLATDPFDPHRMASFGDGAVTIWDVRHRVQPLMTFTEKDASADGAKWRSSSVFTTIEFSSTRRGLLATLEKDANHVRFWNFQQADAMETLSDGATFKDREKEQSAKTSRLWSNPTSILPWTSSNTVPSTPVESPTTSGNNLILSDTRRSRSIAVSHHLFVNSNCVHVYS